MPVGRDYDGPVEVRSPCPDAVRFERRERRRAWMAETVAPSNGNHGLRGRHGVDELPGGRRAAAVVAYLEDIRPESSARDGEEHALLVPLRVADEEQGTRAVRD